MAAVWTGELRFALVRAGVRLEPGPARQGIHYHLLHAVDGERLRQQFVCPRDGETVAREQAARGYQAAGGDTVVLGEREVRAAAPVNQRLLEVVKFCRAEEIDPLWLDAVYYVEPETEGRAACALLRDALDTERRVALCRLVLREREWVALLRPTRLAGVPGFEPGVGTPAPRRGLLLHTLYYPEELRLPEGFGAAEEAAPAAQEMELAARLVERMTRPFAPETFQDRYRENLERLIEARRRGQRVRMAAPAPEEPATRRSLLHTLQQSLEEQGPERIGPRIERAPRRRRA